EQRDLAMERRPSVLEDPDQVVADQVVDAGRSRLSEQAQAASGGGRLRGLPRRERARLEAAPRHEGIGDEGQILSADEKDLRVVLLQVFHVRVETTRMDGTARPDQGARMLRDEVVR